MIVSLRSRDTATTAALRTAGSLSPTTRATRVSTAAWNWKPPSPEAATERMGPWSEAAKFLSAIITR